MFAFSNGSTPPPLPSEEVMEAARAFTMTAEEEKAFHDRIDAEIAEYLITHPDNWKPEHLK